MAHRQEAYRASTGRLFATMKEAEQDEINTAAALLGGVSAEGLLNIVSGTLSSPDLRDALRRLAQALPPEPVAPHESR